MNTKIAALCGGLAMAAASYIVFWIRRPTSDSERIFVPEAPSLNLVGLQMEVDIKRGVHGEVTIQRFGRKSASFTVIHTNPSSIEIRGQAPVGSRPRLTRFCKLVITVPPLVARLDADSCARILVPSIPLNLSATA